MQGNQLIQNTHSEFPVKNTQLTISVKYKEWNYD